MLYTFPPQRYFEILHITRNYAVYGGIFANTLAC
jgi:hypothetical protein